MIKLHKPKIDIKSGTVINPAHVKVNIKGELSYHEAMIIGQRLIDLANHANNLNLKVTK